MADSIEVSAKNVNDATNLALQRLGKKQDEVDIEVLNGGSRGILGIGAEDAVVRVTVRKPPAPPVRPAPEPQRPSVPEPVERPARPSTRTPRRASAPAAKLASEPAPAPTLASEPAPAPRLPSKPAATAESISDVPAETVAVAAEVVTELLRLMGLKGEVHMRGAEPRGSRTPDDGTLTCTADVTGDDLGILIGRRGENLTALQYITNLIVSKRTDSNVRVVVDVEHYLVRRYESLRGLALRMADRVKQSHSSITLEPMPPHERRIVHMTLADNPSVSTVSIGEGEERRVVISARK